MGSPCALVIGGSLGGLFAATLLRTIGWNVTVFERARSNLAGRGAGLGSREELFAVMRRIGIDYDDSIGVDVRSRIWLDRSGAIVHEIPVHSKATAWDRIYRAVRSVLPKECYRPGMQLERFKQDARCVTAHFADGSRAEGDLLIGADGIHSTVRRQLMPELEPRYAGYVHWRGAVGEDDVPGSLHAALFDHMNFCFPEGELAFSVPMPAPDGDARGNRRRCQFGWFRPADYETRLPQMCTDASGRRHGVSIPPPLIRAELIEELRDEAKMRLAPQIAALIGQVAQPILQPIFDLESPQIVFGKVALLGDAAFVARPHVGTGVTKAALDAQCLADALGAEGSNLDAALTRYDRERRQFGSWLVARGRYLGAYLEAQLKPREERGEAELNRRPEIVMRELGAAGVIDGDPINAWRS
jgi:2-polyprenyl-6-methoxyphenol hydroxylase-like FAD-dependent oxidoreductase